MRKRLLIAVGLFTVAFAAFVGLAHTAPPEQPKAERWHTLANAGEAGGLWVQREGGKPVGALYASKIGGKDNAVLGFYKDGSKADAHDFAISADKDGVSIQVRDDKGKLVILPASALAKLADGYPVVLRGPPEPEPVEGIGRGELRKRIVLQFVRKRAVDRLVKDGVKSPDGKVRKVTREQARELVDGVKDETILGSAIELGAPVEGGKLEALINWLWEHKEQIIKFILMLVSLFADESP